MDWMSIFLSGEGRRGGVRTWILAVIIAALAIGLRVEFATLLDPTRYITYFVAIGAAAFLCGWRQAILVLIMFIGTVRYFSVPHHPDGPLTTAQIVATVLIGSLAGGLEIAIVSGFRDAIDRLRHVNTLQETLFSELQHRVANNMQTIASMLDSTKRSVSDPIALEVIEQAVARTTSLAKLHRQLYTPAAYENGLGPVLQDVLNDSFFGLSVDVKMEIVTKGLSIDQMTAIVLLVNEAALNAVKHVFRPVQGTSFSVALQEPQNGVCVLTISDDGPGIRLVPEPSPQARTLGMNLMRAFAQQLGGQLEMMQGRPGTTLRVEFTRS